MIILSHRIFGTHICTGLQITSPMPNIKETEGQHALGLLALLFQETLFLSKNDNNIRYFLSGKAHAPPEAKARAVINTSLGSRATLKKFAPTDCTKPSGLIRTVPLTAQPAGSKYMPKSWVILCELSAIAGCPISPLGKAVESENHFWCAYLVSQLAPINSTPISAKSDLNLLKA